MARHPTRMPSDGSTCACARDTLPCGGCPAPLGSPDGQRRESWCKPEGECRARPGRASGSSPGSETSPVSYAASIPSASPRLALVACSATNPSSPLRPSLGGSGFGSSSQGSEIFSSEKQRDPDHPSSRPHNTAPTRRVGGASEGSACTTLDLRLTSPSVLSCTLFARVPGHLACEVVHGPDLAGVLGATVPCARRPRRPLAWRRPGRRAGSRGPRRRRPARPGRAPTRARRSRCVFSQA